MSDIGVASEELPAIILCHHDKYQWEPWPTIDDYANGATPTRPPGDLKGLSVLQFYSLDEAEEWLRDHLLAVAKARTAEAERGPQDH